MALAPAMTLKRMYHWVPSTMSGESQMFGSPWIATMATVGFGAVGFTDDYLKITRRSHHGLIPRYKMAGQIIVGLAVGLAVLYLSRENPPLYSTRLIFPFFKNLIPDLGVLYVLFAVLVLVCASNGVNLTDGLDGLAISTFGVAAASYTALATVSPCRALACCNWTE